MIRQIFDRAFLLRHLDAFGPRMDQEIPLRKRGDEAAVDPAQHQSVHPKSCPDTAQRGRFRACCQRNSSLKGVNHEFGTCTCTRFDHRSLGSGSYTNTAVRFWKHASRCGCTPRVGAWSDHISGLSV